MSNYKHLSLRQKEMRRYIRKYWPHLAEHLIQLGSHNGVLEANSKFDPSSRLLLGRLRRAESEAIRAYRDHKLEVLANKGMGLEPEGWLQHNDRLGPDEIADVFAAFGLPLPALWVATMCSDEARYGPFNKRTRYEVFSVLEGIIDRLKSYPSKLSPEQIGLTNLSQ